MAFFINEETQKKISRKITIKDGKDIRHLNLDYRDISMAEAANLVDSHVEEIERDEVDERISFAELAEKKRAWLMDCFINDNILVGWDVFDKDEHGKKVAVEITEETVGALLSRGQIFHPIYKDFMDFSLSLSSGINVSQVAKERKNSTK